MAAKILEPVKGQGLPVPVKGELRPNTKPREDNLLAPSRRPHDITSMLIGWTTVAHRAEADHLASEAVARGLAVCVQVDGPVASHYRWAGKDIREEEFRLCFKFLEGQAIALERWLHESHPYTTPEWVTVRAEHVGEKYLSWAKSNPTPSTL